MLPPPPLQETFTSSAITYKDGRGQCRSTKCSIYVPSALGNQPQIDVLVFFHGLLHVCDSQHNLDPRRVIKRFRLDDQVDKAARKAALAVPLVFWNSEDRRSGIIRSAWSAAYLNAFVEEVLDQIGKSSRVRPQLGRLILAGHSAAYDILTPLAEQFDCGVPETKKGALAKLSKVLAMDTIYRPQDAKALEQWARNLSWDAKFILVLSEKDTSRIVWENWRRKMDKEKVKLPLNLDVQPKPRPKGEHCELPGKYIEILL